MGRGKCQGLRILQCCQVRNNVRKEIPLNIKKERASRGHGPKKCIGKKKMADKSNKCEYRLFFCTASFLSDDGLIGKVYKTHPYSQDKSVSPCMRVLLQFESHV